MVRVIRNQSTNPLLVLGGVGVALLALVLALDCASAPPPAIAGPSSPTSRVGGGLIPVDHWRREGVSTQPTLVTEGGTEPPVDLACGRLQGVVVPAGAVHTLAFWADFGREPQLVPVGDGGGFAVPRVPAGTYWLTAQGDDGVGGGLTPVRVVMSAGENSWVVLNWGSRSQVHGRLLDRSGCAAERVAVEFYALDASGERGPRLARVRTDAAGRYQVELPLTRVVVVVARRGQELHPLDPPRLDAVPSPLTIDLRGGGELNLGDWMVASNREMRVHGRIVGLEDESAWEFELEYWATDRDLPLRRRLYLDAEGRFDFVAVPQVDFSLRATLPGHDPLRRQLSPQDYGREIYWDPLIPSAK